jgi:hypothetical protein
MTALSETWFIEGNIDFESKKYTLLAYLQKVNSLFSEHKLYPQLSDIIFHHNNLLQFQTSKSFLQKQFPKRLTGIQLQKLELLYQEMIEDDELMQELEGITFFAAKKIKTAIDNGAEIYDYVEDKLSISPVGILPLDTKEGYFFLSGGDSRSTRVYSYSLFLFKKYNDKYRSIRSQFIDEWQRSFTYTYENIKLELLKRSPGMPTPAVYAIETPLPYPLEETLLPVAKRSLVRYLSLDPPSA